MTIGEKRVRVTFNPSNSDYVHQIKTKAAELINLIDGASPDPKISEEDLKEYKRLMALSLTSLEQGAMWAVKMATI